MMIRVKWILYLLFEFGGVVCMSLVDVKGVLCDIGFFLIIFCV